MYSLRCRVANALFALGISVLPSGRARAELVQLLDLWRTKVERTVLESREKLRNE